MKIENIRVGMVLALKPERKEAYGHETGLVTVSELRPHKTYKQTWVVYRGALGVYEFYKTSDFSRCVGWAEWRPQYDSSKTILLPDGYNGHTVRCYVEPVEQDGDMVKLQVAEPGKEYMTRWAHKNDAE